MDLTSRLFRILFPAVVFETRSRDVHLTFDDGPHPVATPIVLDILREFDIHATFFLTGDQVREFPSIVTRIATEGHVIGNHGYHHENLLLRSSNAILRNIDGAQEIIRERTGTLPTLFRPPYGFYDYRVLRLLRERGLRLVHWTYDVRDFRRHRNDARINSVIRRATGGSILLLHDNEATSGHVPSLLPKLLRSLIDRGLTFSPLA